LVSSDSTLPYWFGVELELALTLRDHRELAELAGASEAKKTRDRNDVGKFAALTDIISQILEDEGLSVSPYNNESKGEKWMVTEDISIISDCKSRETISNDLFKCTIN
jgi:hypothetical protein